MKNSIRSDRGSRVRSAVSGFTLIELIIVIVILGILAATALPRFVNLGSEARASSIQALAGSVKSAVNIVRAFTALRGPGTAGGPVNITWINLDAATPVRIWSGYPDRWCDGIGMTVNGATVPAGGCYLSTTAVPFGNYTFYGFGNSMIPNGDAGWRLEDAIDPRNCSVAYNYNGTGTPVITAYTSGC